MRDVTRTARILSRFGPRLPKIAEELLAREAAIESTPKEQPKPARNWAWFGAGAAVAAAIAWAIAQS
jgi:ubiquinone biosynthesis protein